MLFQSLIRSWQNDRATWIVSIVVSVLLYGGLTLAIPILITRLPVDYFSRPPQKQKTVMVVLRMLAGIAIVAAGVAMLFLPGPGIVAILLGLMLMGRGIADRIARKLVARPRVLDALNAIRQRRGCPPLILCEPHQF